VESGVNQVNDTEMYSSSNSLDMNLNLQVTQSGVYSDEENNNEVRRKNSVHSIVEPNSICSSFASGTYSPSEVVRCKRKITTLGYSLHIQSAARRNERERNRVKLVN